MKKKGKKLFEDIEFTDSYMAEKWLVESEHQMAKYHKAMKIALILTVINIIVFLFGRFFPSAAALILHITVILGIVTYCIGGGIKIALKTVYKITYMAWYICPLYLIDLIFAFVALMFSGAFALYVPALFIWINSKQTKENYEAAKIYLQRYE